MFCIKYSSKKQTKKLLPVKFKLNLSVQADRRITWHTNAKLFKSMPLNNSDCLDEITIEIENKSEDRKGGWQECFEDRTLDGKAQV